MFRIVGVSLLSMIAQTSTDAAAEDAATAVGVLVGVVDRPCYRLQAPERGRRRSVQHRLPRSTRGAPRRR